jgi:hypothetical protein
LSIGGKRRRNEQQAAVDAATKVGFPIDNHQERKGTEKHDVIAQLQSHPFRTKNGVLAD